MGISTKLRMDQYYYNGYGSKIRLVTEFTEDSEEFAEGYRFADELGTKFDDFGNAVDDTRDDHTSALSIFRRGNFIK